MKSILKERGSVYGETIAWDALSENLASINPSKIFVLTDANTRIHCLPYFFEQSNLPKSTIILEMQAGETYKTIDSCSLIWNKLSEKGADRNSVLINLGGGVVTDLGGFVAATFKRGIEFINIPTSLLAMVDASVGGKNGVDLGVLKNQIGVIKNPLCVIIDTKFLKTLSQDHLISGYAEMLKHGLIHSEVYWNKVKNFDVSQTSEAASLIWESVEIKNKVVTQDPFEHGLRKTLNYGHTLGHAIESHFLDLEDKQPLLHGEAVAIGMILATYISSKLVSFPKSKLEDITSTILQKFPKSEFKENDITKIIELLIFDKKSSNGKVNFVLLEDFGKHKLDCEVSNDIIFKAFSFYKNF